MKIFYTILVIFLVAVIIYFLYDKYINNKTKKDETKEDKDRVFVSDSTELDGIIVGEEKIDESGYNVSI